MNAQSPFQYRRWESDDHHIIWLPPRFSEWEGKRSTYFTGSRGSGKTTLLRAFEWSVRLHNESLRKQIGPDPFSNKYIGVYLSAPDYITYHFVNWPKLKEKMDSQAWEEEKGRIYCLYLEYYILQLSIKAIQGLLQANILHFSPEHELQTVQEILDERPEIKKFLFKRKSKFLLSDLRLAFKFMHENLRQHAIHDEELPSDEGYPTLQMGQMLEEIASYLIDLCSKGAPVNKNKKRWMFKVCMDQAESIEYYQQKAINTMVARLGTGDISFVIAASTGLKDINDTFIPHHTLNDDDRIYTSLESIYKKEKFHKFAHAVTELRMMKYINKDNICVNLKTILGDWSINQLLDIISFKNTESKNVKDFVKRSRENMSKNFFRSRKDGLEGIQSFEDDLYENLPMEERSAPPFYETYLIQKGFTLDLNIINKEEIRAIKSQEFRKKMVSAMLCLCKEFRLPIPFAGYTMVMSMSDTCIRDFLRIMHEIYLAENCNAERFSEKCIDPKKQNEAIRKASESRYLGISYEPECHISDIKKLVDSLGKITSEIQSSYRDLSTLKSTERGIFEIDFNRLSRPEDRKELREIIQEAIDSHIIRIYIESKDENKISFRLHKLFSAKFNFSYRGAYYPVPLDSDILLNLCKEDDEQIIKKMESKEIGKINRYRNQLLLSEWGAELDD